ncbi:MAG: bifunctional hydroxymethylpyrimidine kinase/phosphomethylpyrimidine kinase [Myxococcota bacterium]|nr:bifunctional hydroxymethylpyrimidine kinase/phosphomethylpyrimidine kinase [Myxococcota bacterium]
MFLAHKDARARAGTYHPFRMLSALSIAGSDPTGGAGLQADLQVFHALGVHGAAVPTALTVQDGLKVKRVLPVFPSALLEMLRMTIDTIRPAAIKIGMLGTDDAVRNTTLTLAPYADIPVVLDPVLAANVHFEDHLEDGIMEFDYSLRDGTVEKSNALELMRSVGLDV